MRLAVEAGRAALGRTAPNPPVGAVIVRGDEILGVGYTRPPGGPHAEVVALADARSRGHDVRGATIVVTLEPCCHHGRTPPCTDAIVEAGLSRCVVGVVDPYPPMRGRSLDLLRAAGIAVALGPESRACTELMLGFLRVHTGGLPEVALKVATSLDGRIATATGESRWITGESARRHGHVLRDRHDAIVVGIGTVLADDPALTCRLDGGRDPVPVVLDTGLRTPVDAALLRSSRRAVIVCAEDAPERAIDADVVRVARGPGGLDVRAALGALAARGLHRILVEGGARVHRALLDAGVVDHLYVYVAGTVIPGGLPWIGGAPVTNLADAPRFGVPDVHRLGDDVLMQYRLGAEVR